MGPSEKCRAAGTGVRDSRILHHNRKLLSGTHQLAQWQAGKPQANPTCPLAAGSAARPCPPRSASPTACAAAPATCGTHSGGIRHSVGCRASRFRPQRCKRCLEIAVKAVQGCSPRWCKAAAHLQASSSSRSSLTSLQQVDAWACVAGMAMGSAVAGGAAAAVHLPTCRHQQVLVAIGWLLNIAHTHSFGASLAAQADGLLHILATDDGGAARVAQLPAGEGSDLL